MSEKHTELHAGAWKRKLDFPKRPDTEPDEVRDTKPGEDPEKKPEPRRWWIEEKD